jgi:hypothetical protein
MNKWKKHYNERRIHKRLDNQFPQQSCDDNYTCADLLRQPEALNPEEKSRIG